MWIQDHQGHWHNERFIAEFIVQPGPREKFRIAFYSKYADVYYLDGEYDTAEEAQKWLNAYLDDPFAK